MKQELDELLCTRYPLIFAERNRPITESCMGFGFSCGDGWFTLIDTLCARLQFEIDRICCRCASRYARNSPTSDLDCIGVVSENGK